MNILTRRTGATLAVLLGTALALAGCSAKADDSATNNMTPEASTPAAIEESPIVTPEPEGTPVAVIETEFSISLAQSTLAPGTYTFEIANDGGTTHNLNISGPGIDGAATSSISSGGSDTLTVTLEAGDYILWCSIGSHRANGMEISITVE